MKKIIICISLSLFAVIAMSAMSDRANPLRKPPEQIRESLLELTPIGTSKTDAIEILKAAGVRYDWMTMRVNTLRGVAMHQIGEVGPAVGETAITILFGRYGSGIWWRLVDANWAFDENEELIEIFVRKGTSRLATSDWEGLRDWPSATY